MIQKEKTLNITGCGLCTLTSPQGETVNSSIFFKQRQIWEIWEMGSQILILEEGSLKT